MHVSFAFKLDSALAHPAPLFCRYAQHQRIRRHISVDNSPCTDKCVFANSYPAHYGGVGSQCRASTNMRLSIFVLARDGGTRVVNIGKDHTGTAKDIVIDLHCVIYRDVVLHFDVVADHHVISHEDILPERTMLTNPGTATDVRPMPHSSSLTDSGTIVNDGGGMDCVAQDQYSSGNEIRFPSLADK